MGGASTITLENHNDYTFLYSISCQLLLQRVHHSWGSLFFGVPCLVLHVRLHRPPQCLDVPLTKTSSPLSLDQLQEESVLCEDGLGEHLEEVSGSRRRQAKY